MIKPTEFLITTPEENGSEIIVREMDGSIQIFCPDADERIWLSVKEAEQVAQAIKQLTETNDDNSRISL